MSRISARFAELREKNAPACVPFMTAGDPKVALTVPLMHALVAGGADIIELGVPFSDPMADGPTIQQSSERALAAGVTLAQTLGWVKEFREQDQATPVVLMGYLNPVEMMGHEAFIQAAADSGVDGVLMVDMPLEESKAFHDALAQKDLDFIYLLAPTSGQERRRHICQAASGFLYFVSMRGVTGGRALQPEEVAEEVAAIRGETEVPVGVGFGIRDRETAQRVGRVADAVIVGSALVKILDAEREAEDEKILITAQAWMKEMAAAVHGARDGNIATSSSETRELS